jgi:dolichyl-phosphate-mannose-protein mannosyltransferase
MADTAMKARLLLLVLLTILGGWLRFTATGFGLPDKYRPDEQYLVGPALGFERDWNPHFALYPAAQMYVDHAILWICAARRGQRGNFRAAYSADEGALAYLVLRRASAAFGTAAIPAIYSAAAPVLGPAVGLTAAAILTFSTIHVRESKYATTDAAAGFWLILALAMILRVVQRGRFRDYAAAGFFTGLATATKYPAGALMFAIAAAHLEARRREGRSLLRSPLDMRIYVAAYFAILVFFCATPYFFLDWPQTVHDYQYQRGFILGGLNNPLATWGWSWLMLHAMPEGLGIALQVFLLASMLWALIFPRPGTKAMLAFLAIAFLGITGGRYVFYRYIVMPLPAMALLGGLAAADLTAIISGRLGRSIALAAVPLAVAMLLAPSLIRDLQLNRIMLQTDTRTLARRWIEANVPRGVPIAITDVSNYCGKPQLDGRNMFVPLESPASLRTKNIHWVLSDSFPPIAYYSRGMSEAEQAALEAQATLMFDVAPIRHGAPAPAFDPQDAFYTPIGNISGMERPGPRIRIWKLK